MSTLPLEGKRVLITGGTGSLGKVLVQRLLSGEMGTPKQIIVFSRDEAKQHYMRLEYLQRQSATDEIIYRNFRELLVFRIGDVRDFYSLCAVLSMADVVFNAAALKQVPTCEYFPFEAVQTSEYSSAGSLMTRDQLYRLLEARQLLVNQLDSRALEGELLR